jgi:hypothetical protein
MEKKRHAYRLFVGKPEGKSPIGRQRRRWTEPLRWTFRERMEWGKLDWSGSGLGKMESSCELGNERFEVFTAVTMKNCVFWVVTPCRATRRNNPEDTILR